MKLLNFLQAWGLRLIIILFFIVSVIGIFHDYSLNTGGDESVLMAAAVNMISDHTLRPDYPTFYHVPFAAYFYLVPFILFFIFLRLAGVFTSLDSLREFGTINFYNFLPLARFLTVLMGMISIYLLYRIAQKLFNNKLISFSAAFFLSSSLMFVQLSHLARVWVPQVMTILLAFYLIVILYQRQESKIRDYFLVGLSVGLAFGTHAIGVIVYSPFFIAHCLKNFSVKKIFINRYFWIANAVIVLFYFLTFYLNPHGFKNYINRGGGILPNFSFLFDPAATGSGGTDNGLFFNIIDSFKNFAYYTKILIEWEPILFLFFMAGSAFLFLKARKIFFIIISFVSVYYIGASFSGLTWYYILPIIPFLSLIAGYGLYYSYRGINAKTNKTIALIVILIIFILHFAPALAWDYLLIQPSSRLAARDWVYKNVPAGKGIINFDPLLELNENPATLHDIKKLANNFFNKKRAYLLAQPEESHSQPNYYILNYTYYDNNLPEELLDKKYEYLVIGWGDARILKTQIKQVERFGLKATLLKRFPESADENSRYEDIRDLRRPIYAILNGSIYAPVVDVYKLE